MATRPPSTDPHQCAWREYAEALEARVTILEQKFEALAAHVHKSEKLPRVADEVREKRARDPAKTRAVRAERADMKAKLVEERIVDQVPEPERYCPKCNNDKLRKAGEKTSTIYEYVTGYFRRQVHVRETLACSCGEYIVTAPAPEKSTDKTHYGPGFVAHLLTAKCADSIPLYRLEKQYARAGVPIARSTMTDLFHRNAELLAPLSNRLLALVGQLPIVQADETSLRRLDVKKRGFLWTFLGDVPAREGEEPQHIIAYAFSADRSGKTPSAVLGSSTGTLVVDAYTGYNAVTTPEGRERAACLAHARRKLFAASGQDRTTLLFSAGQTDAPGALHRLLTPLAEAGISMTRIESRPSHKRKWDYVFFIDIEGHVADPAVEGALAKLRKQASLYRVLGSYPRALI